jgi:hypothetical protein
LAVGAILVENTWLFEFCLITGIKLVLFRDGLDHFLELGAGLFLPDVHIVDKPNQFAQRHHFIVKPFVYLFLEPTFCLFFQLRL